jgi:hypothetical protein
MNISVLDKLEKGSILLDWSIYLVRMNLTSNQLSKLIDKLDNWKSNRRCKEIILVKYKSMPVYVTLKRGEFKKMSDWLMTRLTELEMYEECAKLYSIKNKL